MSGLDDKPACRLLLKLTCAMPSDLPDEIETLGDYKELKCFHRGGRHVLYRGKRSSDDSRVVLKALSGDKPSLSETASLDKEFQLLKICQFVGVPNVLALASIGSRQTIAMEDAGESTIIDWKEKCFEDLDLFFRLATDVASVVDRIHTAGIMHLDLCPGNIVIDGRSRAASIVDFGSAALLSQVQSLRSDLFQVGKSLLYVSPEQTGRLNAVIDARSDLYSLGTIFYELLTGVPPFMTDEPLSLVHAHLSLPALAPEKINARVPADLSQIILKLLEKSPENRYQSAYGLLRDLAEAKQNLEHGRSGEPFRVGRFDRAQTLQLPARLYGREAELSKLIDVFESASGSGAPNLLLVSGYSGIGKTSLVSELYKPLVQERGFFLTGKFDQYKRDVPLSTIAQTFREHVRHLLSEPDPRLKEWQRSLQECLGLGGGVLAKILPEIELLIGKQPPVPELSAAEEQVRFDLIFSRFISVFARKEHPLILFLDDLQWCDSASLRLIRNLLTSPGGKLFLLLIGAYRDNEVDSEHPLRHMVQEVESAALAKVTHVRVPPLSLEHLTDLIADSLTLDRSEIEPLAELIYDKTRGNPFFGIQFLRTLHQESMIKFDRQTGSWGWDMAKVRMRNYASDIVDLLLFKFKRLRKETRDLLKIAACLGNKSEIATLAVAIDLPEQKARLHFGNALAEGLLIAENGSYRFLHDRVQQAAYALIPEAELAGEHLNIGRRLLKNTRPADMEANIFDIVNQLNAGAMLMHDQEERLGLAELNLMAGRKAKASTAHAAAVQFFTLAKSLLPADCWEAHYKLAFDLSFEQAECQWMAGEFDESMGQFSQLLERCHSTLEKAAIYRMQVELYTDKTELGRAVESGLEGLKLFGLTLAAHPQKEEVKRAYDELFAQLGGRSIEELADLPIMSDTEMRAAMDILQSLYAAALCSDQNLFLLCACHMVDISLRHGNCDASVMGYGFLGMGLGRVFGKYDEAYRFGKLGCDLVEKRGLEAYKGRIEFIFGDTIIYWLRHLRNNLEFLNRSFEMTSRAGDVTFAGYCCNHIVIDLLVLGLPLKQVYQQSQEYMSYLRSVKFEAPAEAITGMQRLMKALLGETDNFCTFDDGEFSECSYERFIDAYPHPIVTCWYYIMKLEARFLCGDFEAAVEAAEKARPLLWSSLGHIQEPEWWYFYPLALAAHAASLDEEGRARAIDEMRACEVQLAEWASTCPDNFLNKHALVKAELNRLAGNHLEAEVLYEHAVDSARSNGFVQNQAIANEVAAKFYFERGLDTIGSAYLREAHSCYARWQAQGKVDQLVKLYPHLRRGEEGQSTLDLLTVLKSAQAISSEVVLESLLQTLMKVVLQSAGAQRGILLLKSHDELIARARAEITSSDDESQTKGDLRVTIEEKPLDRLEDIPMSLVNYVSRTQEMVAIGDAARGGLFAEDGCVRARGVRSLLCLPIVKQSKLTGILYLENNLVANIFTHEKLDMMRLLCSQIVIALENGLLFEGLRNEVTERQRAEAALRALNLDLEARVIERTRELEVSNRELSSAKEAAESASKFKSEFVASISHELRTPMNAVIGMSDLLARTRLDSHQLELVSTIQHSGHVLLDLINDVLDYSKIEAGKLELETHEFDLTDLVETCVELVESSIPDKDISLSTFIAPHLAGLYTGSPLRLRQVVLNLLSNAVRFTERGEVSVAVTLDSCLDDCHIVRVCVRDTGCGIASANMENLFEPFSQADETIAAQYGGTGLGLAISRRLVESMGGEIGVESTEGSGTSFSFTVRLKRVGEASALQPAFLDPPGRSHLAGRRLLLIAGPPDADESIRQYAEAWGMRCSRATSAGEALKALLEGGKDDDPFSLMVLDPLTRGSTVALALAQAALERGIKVIIISTRAGIAVIDEKLQSLASVEPLVRPVKMKALSSRLLEALGSTKLEASAGSAAGPSSAAPHMASRALPVLLVEDNPVNQKLALLQLKELGFEAHAVSNGLEALQSFQSESYSLILMDCRMPEMNGYEAARRIRILEKESGEGGHVPIIAMTAQAISTDRQECLEAGMDDYMSKPITLAKLRSAILRWVPVEMPGESCGEERKQSFLATETRTALQERLNRTLGPDAADILDKFVSSADELVQKATLHLSERDCDGMKAAAHQMIGLFAALDLRELSKLSRRLEQCTTHGDWDEVRAVLESLAERYRRLRA